MIAGIFRDVWRSGKWMVGCVVAGHLVLLLAYTLPSTWVPLRARFWAQAYARVFFHQDWRLFAPDPPACGCVLEVGGRNHPWTSLAEQHDHFIWQRMCANACRYAEACGPDKDGAVIAPTALMSSLRSMANQREGGQLFRVRNTCGGPARIIKERTQ